MTGKPKIKGRIEIAQEMCKSCEYCIANCPKQAIELAGEYNVKGYYPARPKAENECNGCGICAIVCPEAIIEVWRE